MKLTEEERQQVSLFDWATMAEGMYPELSVLYHPPMGGLRPKKKNPKTGKWYSPGGAKLKRMGAKAGVPDIHLPIARHGYSGLWIEMKTRHGRLSKAQEKWYRLLQIHNNRVIICRSWIEAKNEILDYLGYPPDELQTIS